VNPYEAWSEHRTKIPEGRYLLKCLKGEKVSIWQRGRGGWGGKEEIVLWFEVLQGDYMGKIVPMFLPIGRNGRIPQGSKYFTAWCIANGLRRPQRARLKEMPPLKFKGKVFEGQVVDVRPKWVTGEEQPSLFHYSRVDVLYELVVGNPNS
jgi:hypothetical protein